MPIIHPNLEAIKYEPLSNDSEVLRRSITNYLIYIIGREPSTATDLDWYTAFAQVVRNRLLERRVETKHAQLEQHKAVGSKHVYYLSIEYLIGRALSNSLQALGIYDSFASALSQLGIDIDEAREIEPDAALGNGGLGRLAACFLDSLATLELPSHGYGLRYKYGMFSQSIHDGNQVEHPDDWLRAGNPWEIPRPDITFSVHFGGNEIYEEGVRRWINMEEVIATAYDMIIPGHNTKAVSTLRLWSAVPPEKLDLDAFNHGDYTRALASANRCENITRVLYPDDSTYQGRELRLRQEYFLCSASIQDMLRRHLFLHTDFSNLADNIAIHLNDTHPATAVPELMRLLVNVHCMEWEEAWSLCTRIFSYTNHTLMPEALETVPVSMMRAVLPQHLDIILEVNARFLSWVREEHGEDVDLLRRVSLIDEAEERRVRMANLSVIASHRVNGVSKLHSELLSTSTFADFAMLYPDRFVNKTNGISPRRWLAYANRSLANLIDSRIGNEWRTNLDNLAMLRPLAEDPEFVAAVRAIKAENKVRLAMAVKRDTGVVIDPAALFDVQVKRIHEYKRQLLNIIHVITRYNAILEAPDAGWVPRACIFGGKAASAYRAAKLIIKLINDVAHVVNKDPRVKGLLSVVFLPNYNVSVAEVVMPAADLSEQISTAGTEASGTGNMKFALNGALTIGTLDGANIEIRENVGAENIFIFGHTEQEVSKIVKNGYVPRKYYEENAALKQSLDQIHNGLFSPNDPTRFHSLVDSLLNKDKYLVLADFASYVKAQNDADELYKNPEAWTRKTVLNIAGMGPFSSDRTIREYAEEIWKVKPVSVR